MPAAMRLKICFDHPGHLLLSSCGGTLTFEGVRQDRDLIGLDMRFDPRIRRLLDGRDLLDSVLNPEELQLLGRQSAHAAEAPRVLLVGSDDIQAIAVAIRSQYP